MMHARIATAIAILTSAACAGCDNASSAGSSSAPAANPAAGAAADALPVPPAPGQLRPSGPNSVAIKPDPKLPARDAAGILESSFDDVRFEMDKTADFQESMLSESVKKLFNDRIRIRGYMYPTLRKRGLKQFVLVRDNMECCFGPGAAIYDCILVTMQEGVTTEYSIRPIAVEGKFRFDPLKGPDGRALAIYQMVGEAVK